MAFTYTVEDGTGTVAGANGYASLSEANDYHSTSVSNAVWTALTDDQKRAALAMATRVIDATFTFSGYKRLPTQPLQWPRFYARDRNQFVGAMSGSVLQGGYWPDNAVPKPVKDATAELARLLTVTDRTAEADGVGLKKVEIFEAVAVEFNPRSLRPTVPSFVAELLNGLGALNQGGAVGSARIERA